MEASFFLSFVFFWIFYLVIVVTDTCQYIAHYVPTWPEERSVRPCYGDF